MMILTKLAKAEDAEIVYCSVRDTTASKNGILCQCVTDHKTSPIGVNFVIGKYENDIKNTERNR